MTTSNSRFCKALKFGWPAAHRATTLLQWECAAYLACSCLACWRSNSTITFRLYLRALSICCFSPNRYPSVLWKYIHPFLWTFLIFHKIFFRNFKNYTLVGLLKLLVLFKEWHLPKFFGKGKCLFCAYVVGGKAIHVLAKIKRLCFIIHIIRSIFTLTKHGRLTFRFLFH